MDSPSVTPCSPIESGWILSSPVLCNNRESSSEDVYYLLSAFLANFSARRRRIQRLFSLQILVGPKRRRIGKRHNLQRGRGRHQIDHLVEGGILNRDCLGRGPQGFGAADTGCTGFVMLQASGRGKVSCSQMRPAYNRSIFGRVQYVASNSDSAQPLRPKLSFSGSFENGGHMEEGFPAMAHL